MPIEKLKESGVISSFFDAMEISEIKAKINEIIEVVNTHE
jgi:hypothetical protein